MPEFTIDVDSGPIKNPGLLIVENHDNFTRFIGAPSLLRKVIFWVGDVVWPDWFEDSKGREQYLGYAEEAEKGTIDLYENNFLEKAWPRVHKHLDVDGVYIKTMNPTNDEE